MEPNADVVDEWAGVTAPPPPELAPVKVDAGSTALLILDIQTGNCCPETRPRCVASLPRIQALLARARAKGLAVVYSLTRSAEVADICEEVAPQAGEPVVASGVDKFFGTDLETILAGRGIETVIVNGQLVFAGDLLSTNWYPHAQRFFAVDWRELAESLQRLVSCDPKLVYTGHGIRPMTRDELRRI